MKLLLLLFTLTSFAQDNAVEEYCFSSPLRMKQVRQKLNFILVPVDKIQEENECFSVNTPAHRRELIQNYVKNLDSSVRISYSSAEVKREPCQIRVETIKAANEQDLKTEATINQIDLSTAQKKQGGSTTMSIKTIKEFEFAVNQDVIKGECRFITPSRYEITLQVRKDAVPLVPTTLPPGTIVNVPTSELNKVQDTAMLQTTLQLNSGERIEVGSIVKNLKGDSTKVDINSGAGKISDENTQTERVFLSIE